MCFWTFVWWNVEILGLRLCNCYKFSYKKGRNKVFGLDKSRHGWYNMCWATDRPKGRPYGAVAFLVNSSGKYLLIYLCLSRSFIRRGGDRRKTSLPTRFLSYAIYGVRQNSAELYMTWELFFTFCLVVIELLAPVILIFQNNKKK